MVGPVPRRRPASFLAAPIFCSKVVAGDVSGLDFGQALPESLELAAAHGLLFVARTVDCEPSRRVPGPAGASLTPGPLREPGFHGRVRKACSSLVSRPLGVPTR